MTQAQLAEKLGIRQSMVSAITNAVAARIPMLWPGGSVKRSCQRRAPEIWTRKTAMRVNVQWSGKDSGTHNES
ncbi:MAG: helix-turn-helix transcriptional regulator [Chlorobiaceae bacterium]|nr:helix-turn-helix transcriptional regulator [Chlorobiaceae bacterium]